MPTLLLWGKYDFSVSKKMRDEVISNSGSTNLVSVEFEASSHFPMYQEPVLFATTVLDFINGL